MENLAIIPARGGSKGVLRKNTRPLAGRPLIEWTIETALKAQSVTRVVVSTDDNEIAAIAKRSGAQVVKRPQELSDDEASSEGALLHVLETLKDREAHHPDLLVFLQCTSPLTTPGDVDGTVRELLRQDADCAFACVPFHYFVWKRDRQGCAVGVNHSPTKRLLRQQREVEYLESGAVYVMRSDGFMRAKHRFFGKTVPYVTPEEHCFEIDTPHDFAVAEALKCEQLRQQRGSLLPPHIAAIVFDFDGVFTDNKVLVFEDGHEAVLCDRGDGLGIGHLIASGVRILVLSSEVNPVVQARCRKLGLEYISGVKRKWPALEQWLHRRGIRASEAAYVGNDLNDLDCIINVGCGMSVADGHPEVLTAAQIILRSCGGQGAVREVAEMVLGRTALPMVA